jgi:hypothetical protein
LSLQGLNKKFSWLADGKTFPAHFVRMKLNLHHFTNDEFHIMAKAGHSINLGHLIQFQDISILVRKCGCMEHIIRKAVETELHPNNMNREECFSLSKYMEASHSND